MIENRWPFHNANQCMMVISPTVQEILSTQAIVGLIWQFMSNSDHERSPKPKQLLIIPQSYIHAKAKICQADLELLLICLLPLDLDVG